MAAVELTLVLAALCLLYHSMARRTVYVDAAIQLAQHDNKLSTRISLITFLLT